VGIEIKQVVLKILKKTDKPMKTGDIAKKIGVDSKEVSKIIKEDKIYSSKRCYYVSLE